MIWLLISTVWGASITLAPPPQVGETTVVTVLSRDDQPLTGVTVSAIRAPDLPDAAPLTLGVTDALGRVRWTPDQSGVVEIRSGDVTQRVAVPWGSPPPDALVILAMAAFGAIVALLWGHSRRNPTRVGA